MLRQYSSAVVSGLRIFLARPLPSPPSSFPAARSRARDRSQPLRNIIEISYHRVWVRFLRADDSREWLNYHRDWLETTVIKRKLGLWGGRTDRGRSWSLESWKRWKGLKMEPEQRRIPDREGREREREIGDLFACNRSRVWLDNEIESAIVSPQMCPTPTPFYFGHTYFPHPLLSAHLPRFVTLNEYSYIHRSK